MSSTKESYADSSAAETLIRVSVSDDRNTRGSTMAKREYDPKAFARLRLFGAREGFQNVADKKEAKQSGEEKEEGKRR